jgi:hypothetical protein
MWQLPDIGMLAISLYDAMNCASAKTVAHGDARDPSIWAISIFFYNLPISFLEAPEFRCNLFTFDLQASKTLLQALDAVVIPMALLPPLLVFSTRHQASSIVLDQSL